MPNENVQTPPLEPEQAQENDEVAEQPVTVVVDTKGMKDDLTKEMTGILERLLEAKSLERAEAKGTSQVDEALRVKEELVERIKGATKKEQWMVAIPGATTKELTGHLRDFCQVTEIIQGKPGDTVNY